MQRDWRAGATLSGFLAGWLRWFYFGFNHRTMFLFYATPMIPFMVLSIVLVMGYLIGPAPAAARGAQASGDSLGRVAVEPAGAGTRRLVGAAAAGAFVLVVLANFAYFHPILSAETIPYVDWQDRMWFESWV